MAKEIVSKFKIQIKAGSATPAPPLGPTLGQKGIPINDFCSEFNKLTLQYKEMGFEIPVNVVVYKDRTYKMFLKQPTVASMLKYKAGVTKGSSNPNKQKVGKVKKSDIEEIARIKLSDLNTSSIESAKLIVEGTAKSLGIEIY
jgi:large subunit ribosomal protein L11